MCKEAIKDLSKRLLITWKNITRGEPQTQWGNDIYVYMSNNSYRDIKNQYKNHTYRHSYINDNIDHKSIKQQFTHTISCLVPFSYFAATALFYITASRIPLVDRGTPIGRWLPGQSIIITRRSIKLDGIAPKNNTHPIRT